MWTLLRTSVHFSEPKVQELYNLLQKFMIRLLIYFLETQVQDLCNTFLECWSGIGLMAQSLGSVLLLLLQHCQVTARKNYLLRMTLIFGNILMKE
jgi:hypothetical protein